MRASSSKSSGLHRLSRGFSSARRPVSDGISRSVILWTASVELAPQGHSTASPFWPPELVVTTAVGATRLWLGRMRLPLLRTLLRWWVRSTAGAAILYLLSNPDVGGLPSASPGLSVVSLTDPPLTRTPRPRDNGGSHLVCLQSDPHWEQQSFSSALTRLLAVTGSLPHRSHAHQTTPCTLHVTAKLVLSVSYRLEQPI